jgi:predicted metal-binding membrane protein
MQMTDSTLETVLRRDRWVVGGAIGIIVALAWSYVLWLGALVGGRGDERALDCAFGAACPFGESHAGRT